jgi:hypothetical protein
VVVTAQNSEILSGSWIFEADDSAIYNISNTFGSDTFSDIGSVHVNHPGYLSPDSY